MHRKTKISANILQGRSHHCTNFHSKSQRSESGCAALCKKPTVQLFTILLPLHN